MLSAKQFVMLIQETVCYIFVKTALDLINCFTNDENELDEDILYMQWLSMDQTTMNKLTSTIEEYINLLSGTSFYFKSSI